MLVGKIAYLNYTTIVSREKSRRGNVKINIKNKFSWVNKKAVRINVRMFMIKEFLKNLSVNLMLFVFLKHGVNHRTRIIFNQAIIAFINIGNIAEEEVCVSL